MSGSGIIGGVIRAICHVPLALYGYTAFHDWKLLKTNATAILAPPLSRQILKSKHIAGGVGVFATYWNYIMWIPSLSAYGSFLFLIGLVDAIIAVALAYATAIESALLWGGLPARCPEIEAQLISGTSDARLIFFGRLSWTKEDAPDYGNGICRSYRKTFFLGFLVAVLYGIEAFSNIAFGLFCRCCFTSDGRLLRSGQPRPKSRCAALIRTAFGPAANATIIIPAYCAQKRLGLLWRKVLRRGTRTTPVPADRGLVLSTLAPENPAESRLLRLFSYDILVLVARNMHYSDVVNLGTVSRRVRAVVLHQSSDTREWSSRMRRFACEEDSRGGCELCGTQVCAGCRVNWQMDMTAEASHRILCRPLCLQCHCAAKLRQRRRACGCWDERRHKFSPRNLSQSNAWRLQADADNFGVRMVCGSCEKGSHLQERLREKDRRDLERVGESTGVLLPCAECNEPVWGSMWWRCERCKGDCRSLLHAGWKEKLEV